MKKHKDSLRREPKELTKVNCSSQKKLENRNSTDILKIPHKSPNQSDHRMSFIGKSLKINPKGDKEISPKVMQKIFNKIDNHLDKYSVNKSSSRNILSKKTKDRSLILPSLSKRPSNYQSIQSSDVKHTRMKEKSLNYIRRLPTNRKTKKLSAVPIKGTPISKRNLKVKKYQLDISNSSRVYEPSAQVDDHRELKNKSSSLIGSNKNILHDRFRKLLRDSKKQPVGLH